MKKIISKELLSAVLGLDYEFTIQESKHYEINIIKWWIPKAYKEEMIEINIYELAHKCKQWAWKTHNNILSSEVSIDDWLCIVAHFNNDLTVSIDISHSSNTEPEAIFKACEWILNDKVKL